MKAHVLLPSKEKTPSAFRPLWETLFHGQSELQPYLTPVARIETGAINSQWPPFLPVTCPTFYDRIDLVWQLDGDRYNLVDLIRYEMRGGQGEICSVGLDWFNEFPPDEQEPWEFSEDYFKIEDVEVDDPPESEAPLGNEWVMKFSGDLRKKRYKHDPNCSWSELNYLGGVPFWIQSSGRYEPEGASFVGELSLGDFDLPDHVSYFFWKEEEQLLYNIFQTT